MPFRYLDHQADIGILAWGASLDEAFAEGARALFGVMADTALIEPREEVRIECTAPEEPLLFVEMLNALISRADLSGLLFSDITIEGIERAGDELRLAARAAGEPLDLQRHEPGLEVKAATYSGLRYTCRGGTHSLRCLLDI
jgi:SHS2 domain-containing protein